MKQIEKLAQENAKNLGYFPGSCSAQGTMGYIISTGSFECGYVSGITDAIKLLKEAFNTEEDLSSVSELAQEDLIMKISALSSQEVKE